MTSTFGFGQNDVGVGNKTEKFKGEKGRVYRVGFAWWPDIEKPSFGLSNITVPEDKAEELTPKFTRASRNYIEGVGYVINKGPEYTQLAGGNQPKVMVATVIISWPLGKNNQPTKDSLFSKLPDVLPWVFAGDKYEKLKKMHLSGYPMHDWDIQADCEETQFQKFTFLPAKNCLFKEMMKQSDTNEHARRIVGHIIEQTRLLVPQISRDLGQDLTLDQLRERMGQPSSSPVGGGGSTVIGGDKEVDNLLDSMLSE